MLDTKIESILTNVKSDIILCTDRNIFQETRSKYLGKNAEINDLLKLLKDVPIEQKAEFGKKINTLKNTLLEIFANYEKQLDKIELDNKLATEKIDISLDKVEIKRGSLHPSTLVINEISDIFSSLGFSIKSGPEIESEEYNFDMLNIPKDHPARAATDTFYFDNHFILRTQTSPIQIRTMLNEKLPLKIIAVGRVYRPDDDASHSPMFQQIEGLVVDENVTLCDLQGLLLEFARKLFKSNVQIRFRPSFFPFTEPSVEVDVSCAICGGKGCRLCKNTGWIEVLGAGIVNPVVLENCGIDSKKYKGLAFGLGVDRIAMIKYGIPDIRHLYQNDVRFIKQYKI